MIWKNHIDQMLHKLCGTCYALRLIFHISNSDTLRIIYFACFYSVVRAWVIWAVIHLTVKRYLFCKTLLEVQLVQNQEISVEVCLRDWKFYLFHVNTVNTYFYIWTSVQVTSKNFKLICTQYYYKEQVPST